MLYSTISAVLTCLDGNVLAEPGAADDAADLHLPTLAHGLDVALVVLIRARTDSTLCNSFDIVQRSLVFQLNLKSVVSNPLAMYFIGKTLKFDHWRHCTENTGYFFLSQKPL